MDNYFITTMRVNNRGMALLLVVAVISLLTVIILQFNKSMRFTLVETSHYQDRQVLLAMAESGIDIGSAALYADRLINEYDTMLEGWAKLQDEPLTTQFSQGEVLVTVTDLSGKFQINSLVAVLKEGQNSGATGGPTPEQARQLFFRLLVEGPFTVEDEIQAREIVDSLVDWLDSDDQESPYGAESSYYESLDKPYSAGNGRFEFMDELLLVRGITTEILYGNSENKGLSEYISVHGDDGRININTAKPEIIRALDNRISLDDVEIIDEFRQEEDSGDVLQNSSWYLGVAGWPGDIVLDSKQITTKSSYFLITSDAVYRESRMRMSAVVKRANKKQLEFLYIRRN